MPFAILIGACELNQLVLFFGAAGPSQKLQHHTNQTDLEQAERELSEA